jgi:hypothetical protein
MALVVFIAANLAVGFTFSTLAKNQLRAMQMAFFFFLPSILLSGFMFPFRGMPEWAQWLGEILSLTHPLRILRGILLKGNEVSEILPNLWPIRRVSSRRGRCGVRALPRYARLNACAPERTAINARIGAFRATPHPIL